MNRCPHRTPRLVLSFVMLMTTEMSLVQALPKLHVSANGRFLVKEDASPFFYLGDTAWELFHRTTREEVDLYLENRAAKGFNVCMAVCLTAYSGQVQNRYGYSPLIDNNPTQPDVREGEHNDYWDHVDYVVNKAESLGIYIAMLPTWANEVNDTGLFNERNAYVYGRWLASRYKNKPIIWVMGGDRDAENVTYQQIWRAMARGIVIGVTGSEDYSQVLMTYHPGPGYSSDWFHNTGFLDFNGLQSGHHARNVAVYYRISQDYAKSPAKPCMDLEPCYEDHPVNWKPSNGYFSDYDVRKLVYWSVFAGAHGVTYGCNDVWQFYTPSLYKPVTGARTDWIAAMDLPGAYAMMHLKDLMTSRPFLTRVPDQGMIRDDSGFGTDSHIQSTRNSDNSYGFVYLPKSSQSVTVRMDHITGGKVNAWWFNPRTGKTCDEDGNSSGTFFGQYSNSGTRQFTSPASGPDWVLVLDDATRGFGRPGTAGVPLPLRSDLQPD